MEKKKRGNRLDQDSIRQTAVEGTDGGLHPAVDGQSRRRRMREPPEQDHQTDSNGMRWWSVTARVWCRGRIDRKRNSTINLTTDSGACY